MCLKITMEKTKKPTDMSYYEILQIEKTATPAEVKKAYYLRARQFHPDKNPDDPSAEEMVPIAPMQLIYICYYFFPSFGVP